MDDSEDVLPYVGCLLFDNFLWSARSLTVLIVEFCTDESSQLDFLKGAKELGTISRLECLVTLKLTGPVFPRMKKVATMLRPLQQLQALTLDEMTFEFVEEGWACADSLVGIIRGKKNLRELSLLDHQLTDEHVLRMLQGPPNELRHLDLARDLYGGNNENGQGRLSDKSLQAIAKSCP
jgi:hypothetical protein